MANCVHHFIIEAANERAQSPGVCQHCGEVRLFVNSFMLPDGGWRDMGNNKLSDKRKRSKNGTYARIN